MLNGIDISNNNSDINLKEVLSKNPIDFVIMKATQGTWFVDGNCDEFYQEAKRQNKLVGVYHYADGTGTPIQEADFFIDNVLGYIHEAILILDWEHYSNVSFYTWGWCSQFVERVHERTGVYPVIYMNESTLRCSDQRLYDFNWKELLSMKCGLWLAQYADNNPTGFQDNPWSTVNDYDVLIHQYSSHGELVGYGRELDLNIGYLTADAWRKVANPENKEIVKPVQKVETTPKIEPVKPIYVGSKVRVKNINDFSGIANDVWVLSGVFEVMEKTGERVVIGYGGQVTGAWRLKDLEVI